jgi:hypothetical protein
MKTTQIAKNRIAALAFASALAALAQAHDRHRTASGLVHEVRQGTRSFHDVTQALGAGYTSSGSCVSGPEKGAMGIHYPNGALVGDGVLDAQRPEVLIYEQRNGRLRLVGVEFSSSPSNGTPPTPLRRC